MCFPIQFLKLVHGITTFTLIVFGSLFIITGSISYTKFHDLMTYKDFYLMIILIGIFSLFISLVGILGSKRQDRCLLGAFNCFILILTLILLTITSILLIFGGIETSILSLTSNQQQNICLNREVGSVTLHDIALAAENQFCQDTCTCYISDPSAWPNGELENFTYTNRTQIPYNVYQFQQCQNYTFQQEKSQVDYLALLENTQNCSGWCYDTPIFLFTNVSRGPPIQNCFVSYAAQVGQRLVSLAYLTLALSFFLATEVIMSCCYQFHPDRDPEKQRLYKNIRYFED